MHGVKLMPMCAIFLMKAENALVYLFEKLLLRFILQQTGSVGRQKITKKQLANLRHIYLLKVSVSHAHTF